MSTIRTATRSRSSALSSGLPPEEEYERPDHLGRSFPRQWSTGRVSRAPGYSFGLVLLLVLFGLVLWGSGSKIAAIVVFGGAVAAMVGSIVVMRNEIRRQMSDRGR